MSDPGGAGSRRTTDAPGRRTRPGLRLALVLGLASTAGIGCARPVEMLEARALPPVAAEPGDVTATWLGTAGVRIDDGQTAILIDPFPSRHRLGAVVFGRRLEPDEERIAADVELDRVAAVLVSHSHYDHLIDAPRIAERSGATLMGSSSTIAVGRAAGLPATALIEVNAGETYRFGAFEVTFLPSRHGLVLAGRVPFPGQIPEGVKLPARARDYKEGATFGIVVRHPRGTLVHHASAGWTEGMYDGVQADVVMLGLAGHERPAAYVEAVVDATGAKRVVPVHWDNFFRPLHRPLRALRSADVPGFLTAMQQQRPDLQIATLPAHQPRVLFPSRGRAAVRGGGSGR